MARQSLTLARAKKLAADAIKDNDAHAEELIELFVRTTDQKANAESQTIKTEILKTWYNATEHYREGFRDFIAQFQDDEAGNDEDELSADTVRSNAPAS
jgi:hypothetical protein